MVYTRTRKRFRAPAGMAVRPAPRKRNAYANYPGARRPTATSRRAVANLRTGGFVGIEKKFLDCAMAQTNIATSDAIMSGGVKPPTIVSQLASSPGCLNSPTIGSAFNQRDGRQINMDSIIVKYQVAIPATFNNTFVDFSCTVFVALVLDTQSNGSAPTSEQIFINPGYIHTPPSPSSGNTMMAQPLRNLQYVKRYQVLDTAIHSFNPTIARDPLGTPSFFHNGIRHAGTLRKTFRNLKTNFIGADAGIAGISDNSLHVVAFCSNTTFASPSLSYISRFRFQG